MTPARPTLDREKTAIRDKVLQMAERAGNAVDRAFTCLREQDVSLAGELIAADEEINRLQRQIEETCMATVATQQPVAADLRTLLAEVHIVDELERIADHGADIARIVTRLAEKRVPPLPAQFDQLARHCRQMLQQVMQAFVDRNAEQARAVAEEDELLDRLEEELYNEIIRYMNASQEKIEVGTLLLWVIHNLERVGDRVTNIAERVIFMQTGEILDLNR